jgi:hypothetical protein
MIFNVTLKRSVAALAVTAGLLAAAGPAGAIVYNGHAGLGSSAYQHNQTDLEFAFPPQGAISDGTSNTVLIGLVAKR